jgi:hypothetical protein
LAWRGDIISLKNEGNVKKTRLLGKYLLVLLVFAWSSSAGFPAGTADSENDQWKMLIDALRLTGPQVTEADKIGIEIRAQAVKEREQYAEKPESLIQQARLRQQTADERLESVLTSEQRVEFRKLKIQRDRDWEYMYLQEGLDLNEQQGRIVKRIVDEYRSKLEAALPGGVESTGSRNSLKDGRLGGSGGLDLGMGMQGGRRGSGAYQGTGAGGGKTARMTEVELERNSRILGVLTDPQRSWAGRIFQMIKTERDSRQKRFMIVN